MNEYPNQPEVKIQRCTGCCEYLTWTRDELKNLLCESCKQDAFKKFISNMLMLKCGACMKIFDEVDIEVGPFPLHCGKCELKTRT